MSLIAEMPILRVAHTTSDDFFRSETQLLEKMRACGVPTLEAEDRGITCLPASHKHTTITLPGSHLVHWPTMLDEEKKPSSYLAPPEILATPTILEKFEAYMNAKSLEFPHALFYFLLGHAPKIDPPAGQKYIPGGTQSLSPRHCHELSYGVLGPDNSGLTLLRDGNQHYQKTLASQSNIGPQHAQELLTNELKGLGVPIKITNRIGVNKTPITLRHTVYGLDSLRDAYCAGEELIKSEPILSAWENIRKAVASFSSDLLPPGIKHMVHQIPTVFLIRPSSTMQEVLEPSKTKNFWLLPFFYAFSFMVQPGGITVRRDQTNVIPSS